MNVKRSEPPISRRAGSRRRIGAQAVPDLFLKGLLCEAAQSLTTHQITFSVIPWLQTAPLMGSECRCPVTGMWNPNSYRRAAYVLPGRVVFTYVSAWPTGRYGS